MTVDPRHPYERALDEADARVIQAERAYEEACAENAALVKQYDENGMPKSRSTPSGRRIIPDDLARIRRNQAQAKKDLTEARERAITARLTYFERRSDSGTRQEVARLAGVSFFPLRTPQYDGFSLLSRWRSFLTKAIDQAEKMPQQLSDLHHYIEDAGVTLNDTELECAVSEIIFGIDFLRTALARLPEPQVMREGSVRE